MKYEAASARSLPTDRAGQRLLKTAIQILVSYAVARQTAGRKENHKTGRKMIHRRYDNRFIGGR